MKYIITICLLWFSCELSWTQENAVLQDPEAAKILDRVASTINSLQSMKADFELLIEDRKEKTKNSSTGNLLLKHNKYKLISEGSTVYFNGTTMWTYVSANNEVTITEPSVNAADFMSNPAGFFTSYKKEFKFRFIREVNKNGILCYEIDLFPKNLNQPYSRIKVFVNKSSDLPAVISSIGKDGVDYTVILKNTVVNQEVPDTAFSFDPAKFKKIEIIDMRGL
jgi:outer membrane lipoprotein-sorting protein